MSRSGRDGIAGARSLALALCFSIAALPACAHRIVRKGEADQEAISRIQAVTSDIRGLDFKEEVEVRVTTSESVRSHLMILLDEEYPGDALEKEERAYKRLGLFPLECSVRDTIVSLLTEQIVGYYDFDTKVLYFVDYPSTIPFFTRLLFRMAGVDIDIEGTLVASHELTHALQDQHYDIEALLESTSTSEDLILAVKSLFEGDAMIVGLECTLREAFKEKIDDMGIDFFDQFQGMPGSIPQSDSEVPEFFFDTLMFQYIEGARFVGEARKRGGWEEVGRLYRDLPTSSEQILHPEKYFDHRDDPIELEPLCPGPTGVGRFVPLHSEVIGEFVTSVLLKQFIPENEAVEAAAGWGGDRFASFEDLHTGEVMFIWLTAWDSEEEASEFYRAWDRLVLTRYGDSITRTESTGTMLLRETGSDIVFQERRGDRVLLVEGTRARMVNDVRRQAWGNIEEDIAEEEPSEAPARGPDRVIR